MTFTGIVALDLNGLMGNQGKIPWELREDMKFFKSMTLHYPVLMGRKTWESLPRKLGDRQCIVLTTQKDYKAEGAIIINSIDELENIELINDEIFIIGGAEIFKLLEDKMTKLYVTRVVKCFPPGDTYWPFNGGCKLEKPDNLSVVKVTPEFTIFKFQQ